MSDIQRFDVGPRISEMAVHNGVAYLAGQVASDATLDAKGQTADVLAQVDALLARAGTDKSQYRSPSRSRKPSRTVLCARCWPVLAGAGRC